MRCVLKDDTVFVVAGGSAFMHAFPRCTVASTCEGQRLWIATGETMSPGH